MKERKVIQTDQAPQAIGPYVQAQQIGPWVLTSGQIPLTPEGELAGEDIQTQTKQVLENMKAVLAKAQCSLDDVVKVTIFIKDMDEFATINEIYGQYFSDAQPSRSCVEVARLPKDVRVEMECMAYSEKI